MLTAEQNYRLLQEIEANRKFLLMAYQQNPELLEHADARIKQLFETPAHGADNNLPPVICHLSSERGISLIELIMFIVIVSVALAGVLLVLNVTTRNSADPLIHKQALAVAESLLEEIQLQDFISQDGTAHICINAIGANCVTLANRTSEYHIVRDYDGFNMAGVTSLNGNPVGLGGYNASVDIADAALGTVLAGSAVLITVTVTDPRSDAIQISGYRTAR